MQAQAIAPQTPVSANTSTYDPESATLFPTMPSIPQLPRNKGTLLQPSLHQTEVPELAQSSFVVTLSRTSYVLVWVVMLLLHASCGLFYAIAAAVYIAIPKTYLQYSLPTYAVSIDLKYFPLIACLHGVLASCHALMALDKVWSSVQARSLQVRGSASKSMRKLIAASRSSSNVHRATNAWTSDAHMLTIALEKVFHAFSKRGLFGVESPHFETVLVCRKTVQILLESYQGYRLSVLMPRAWFNWLFTATIVATCWSPILVQRWFASDVPRARLVGIVLDIALDFLTLIVFPATLFVPCYKLYDPDPLVQSFPWTVWYDDVWFINFFLEAQLIFITSTFNLAVKILLGLNLLNGFDLASSLLVNSKIAVVPVTKRVTMSPALTITTSPIDNRHYDSPPSKIERWASHVGHTSLAVWGIATLCCHLAATTAVSPPQCVEAVRPWFVTSPACSLLEFNCRREQVMGTAADIDRVLSPLHAQSLAYLVVRHCPALTMPSTIRRFPSLVGIKVHNSVLVDWPSEASLNAADHQRMRFLTLVDVNMTRLPDGLLSRDFPPPLGDIEICASNLTALPDDLDVIWPGLAYFILENAQLDAFPDVLTRMGIEAMSLAGNAITEVPEWLFECPWMQKVYLNSNPITTLPEVNATLGVAPIMYRLALDSTNVSTLPSWVTPDFLSVVYVSLGNTPWCANRSATAGSDAVECLPLGVKGFTLYPLYLEKDTSL